MEWSHSPDTGHVRAFHSNLAFASPRVRLQGEMSKSVCCCRQNSRQDIPNLESEPRWMKLSVTSPAPAGAAMFRDHRAWHGCDCDTSLQSSLWLPCPAPPHTSPHCLSLSLVSLSHIMLVVGINQRDPQPERARTRNPCHVLVSTMVPQAPLWLRSIWPASSHTAVNLPVTLQVWTTSSGGLGQCK